MLSTGRATLAGAAAALVAAWLPVHTSDQAATAGSPKSGVTCHTVNVPMRDGVQLATDIYFPAKPGRYPVILQRTPYGLRLGHGCFGNLSGNMAFWAENGYVGITQDARGTFRSQGTFHPIHQEQADGYDAIEWAAAQPWSTGQVGLTGTSYFGVTQWQAALSSPPHLLAMTPGETATDYHDHWTYQNGVFDLWFGQSWLLNFFAPDQVRRQELAKGATAEEAERKWKAYLAQGQQQIFSTWAPHLPLNGMSEYRTLAPYYYEWLEHPNYDEYWKKVDVEAQWDKVKIPALINGGWGDLFAIGSVRSYEGLRAHGGTQAAREGTMLVMQPGGHGGTGLLNYGRNSNAGLQALHLRFYDRYVKGIDNGIDREPRVRLFVQVPPDSGTQAGGFWITSDNAFPSAAVKKVRFNLRSGGHANTRFGDGTLDSVKPSEGADDTFVYDPKEPVPTLGGGLCCLSLGFFFPSGAQDQATLELRKDVLSYTSAPLAEDLAAIGHVVVKFWAKSSAPDTDFTAKLVDVYPNGFAQSLLDRVVRARFRQGSKSAPSPIEPGKAYEYEIDLGSNGTLLKKGHAIRLDLSSSNFPHLARNTNTGKDPASDTAVNVATQTILHDAQHPAYLELSVTPEVRSVLMTDARP
jgi:putative CocE/NonD family hydrolase